MEFFDVIEKRHSVRAYKDVPVEKEKLDRILNAAKIAPTAVNAQAFKLFVIRTKENKEALKKIYGREWFTRPPYVLLVATVKDKCWVRRDGKSYGDVDSAIVMDHIILAATAEGLGTCWIGAFDAGAAKRELGLPDSLEPVAFTPLGYAQDSYSGKTRKDLGDLVEYR